MPKVICTLPNAAELINGVKFTSDRGQMISEEVPDEVAAAFAKIPGYTVAGAKAPLPEKAEPELQAPELDPPELGEPALGKPGAADTPPVGKPSTKTASKG